MSYLKTVRKSALTVIVSMIVLCATSVLMRDVARAGSVSHEARAESLLQDGIDALDDGRPELARRIFETVRAAFPHTKAGVGAVEEIEHLKQVQPNAATRPAVRPATPRRIISAKERDEYLRRLSHRFLTDVGDRVFFAENSSGIGGRARSVIEAQARWLAKYPSVEVIVIGRADDGANESDSTILSRERAKAVEALLVASGVSATRIKVDARGFKDPVAICTAPICQAQNRHAESLLHFPPPAAERVSGAKGLSGHRPRREADAVLGADRAAAALAQ